MTTMNHIVPEGRGTLVQKFGGASVATPGQIKRIAERAVKTQRDGYSVVLVVSAMSGETSRLVRLAHETSEVPNRHELDVIAATGEQVTAGLTALAICAAGGRAKSLLSHQVQSRTDSHFGEARISQIQTQKIKQLLRQGHIPVLAGFQGVDRMGNITTLGRGGSDTTAVAVAAALAPAVCEIYTDVDGIFNVDPNLCPRAEKYATVSYAHMRETSALGAKVLHERSVAIAEKYSVPLCVRNSFNETVGTWVVPNDQAGDQNIEAPHSRSIVTEKNICRLTWLTNDSSVSLEFLIGQFFEHGLVIESADYRTHEENTEFNFTVRHSDLARLKALLPNGELNPEARIAKISVVAKGSSTSPRDVARVTTWLKRVGIKIRALTFRETSFSFFIDEDFSAAAVRAIAEGFEFLKATQKEGFLK